MAKSSRQRQRNDPQESQIEVEPARDEYGRSHGRTRHTSLQIPGERLYPVKPAAARPITVRALKVGYYGDVLRAPGDVFTISDESLLSDIWMEKVPDEVQRGRV